MTCCVLSICGDGFVDTRTGEECEGNGNATTGCVGCKTCTGTQCDTVKMSLCPNGQMKKAEICNGLDDDCDGNVDKGCPCTSADMVACGARDGSGHVLTEGLCQPGLELCENGVFGVCRGAIMPAKDTQVHTLVSRGANVTSDCP